MKSESKHSVVAELWCSSHMQGTRGKPGRAVLKNQESTMSSHCCAGSAQKTAMPAVTQGKAHFRSASQLKDVTVIQDQV